ncbi:hypothetical protein V8F33_012039 [Rhypophila sp. PSN 637]
MSPIGDLITRRASPWISANGTTPDEPALMVICAWPLSGQYGLGTRVIYYGAVVGSVVFHKADWLRSSLLGDVVMLFPAVAALHSIVLAALHVDGATDMDIYGTFQLLVLGVLSAPFTIKGSRTYFNDPGRNIILIWFVMVIAGLLSLIVEFYRMSPAKCYLDALGNKLSTDASNFPYDANPTCDLTCSVNHGPYSPLRQGSANNIYVVPVPDRLSVGTFILMATACCIPSIISAIRMWTKILERNGKIRFAAPDVLFRTTRILESFLSVAQLMFFFPAFVSVLVLTERNFASPQISYQTEPFASIGEKTIKPSWALVHFAAIYMLTRLSSTGQWFPCVGAGILLLVALYFLLLAHAEPDNEKTPKQQQTTPSITVVSTIAQPSWVRMRHGPLNGEITSSVRTEVNGGPVTRGDTITGGSSSILREHSRPQFLPRPIASRPTSLRLQGRESCSPPTSSRQRATSL